MILYLSGPITGDAEYLKKFARARARLEDAGYLDIINPAELYRVMHRNAEREDFLNICLELVDMADAVVLLPGWENSLGANRELGYALGADMEAIPLEMLIAEATAP